MGYTLCSIQVVQAIHYAVWMHPHEMVITQCIAYMHAHLWRAALCRIKRSVILYTIAIYHVQHSSCRHA